MAGEPAPLQTQTPLAPCNLVIFGVTGDLTHRKLVPALYDLSCQGVLPDGFTVVGFGRKALTNEDMRLLLEKAVDDHYGSAVVDGTACERVLLAPRYVQGGFDDIEAYRRLKDELERLEKRTGTANRLFYLATPPSLFPTIIRMLDAARLARRETRRAVSDGAPRPWTRIVIEKPFGSDLRSADELNDVVRSVFDESQVYRIDHYLAKETVQNILMFRFANVLFEPVWNRRYVDHVQITAAESIGVEHRGIYYEEAGALRDMIQNHLMQLFALTAMEPPIAFSADAVRDEKVKVLRAVRPIPPRDADRFAARGQYARGIIDGQPVPAYREEEKVSPTSSVETYAAVKLLIDNWRWEGVPFYLRTGKRLPQQLTEIAVQFKRPPFLLFRQADMDLEDVVPNLLVIRIQPNEGIELRVESKVPGQDIGLRPVVLQFTYGSTLNELPFSPYETLLVDSMSGDQTLFNRDDQVNASWRIIQPILDAWSRNAEIDTYVAGTWGPEQGYALMANDGRAWRRG